MHTLLLSLRTTHMKQIALLFDNLQRIIPTPSTNHQDIASFDINVTRVRRKSISLSINDDKVIVRAPLRTPNYVINDFVRSNTQWIHKQFELQHRQRQERQKIANNERISILGKDYQILVLTESRASTRRQKTTLTVNEIDSTLTITVFLTCLDEAGEISNQLAHNAFIDWLPSFIAENFLAKTKQFARSCNAEDKLSAIKFRRTKSKWGHCTSNGTIQYLSLIHI